MLQVPANTFLPSIEAIMTNDKCCERLAFEFYFVVEVSHRKKTLDSFNGFSEKLMGISIYLLTRAIACKNE